MSDKITEINKDNFEQTVMKSAQPVLVDFWAEWCMPCRMIAPVVEDLAKTYDGKIVVGKINIDDQPELAQKYGVMSIPTLMLFKNGSVENKTIGAVGKDKITKMIDSVL